MESHTGLAPHAALSGNGYTEAKSATIKKVAAQKTKMFKNNNKTIWQKPIKPMAPT